MDAIIALAIQEIPNIIGLIKNLHAQQNPNAPPLTDDDVLAALSAAIESSIAKDELWLSQHPEDTK